MSGHQSNSSEKVQVHTPGPWVLIRCGGRDDSAVATVEPQPPEMIEPNYWTVATANTLRDEWAANARLIAAAPDLLAALIELHEAEEARYPNAEQGQDAQTAWSMRKAAAHESARTAIQRATT